jgi:hypothetical protein
MRIELKYLTTLFSAGAAAIAIAAAPAAAANPGSAPAPCSAVGPHSACQTPGNAQINDSPHVPYPPLYPEFSPFDGISN